MKGEIRMSGIRMTGLISGMDTESMVKDLVKASSAKVDKVKKEKQLLQWKKEAWQSLNTKLYNLYKNELSIFKSNGTYKSKEAAASDETKVSVTAGSGAANGTHLVSVKQLASSAYLTGANIKTSGNSYVTYANAGAKTNFADMTDENGNSLGLAGQKIVIDDGAGFLELELGGTGDNGVASIEELNAKLAADERFKGLKASFEDGNITFTNSSVKKDEDGVETGTNYLVSCDALGISGVVNYKEDKDAGTATTLSGSVSARYKKEFTSSDINGATKLGDIGIAVGTTFSINGKDFVVDKDTTVDDFTAGLSKMGVNASFDEKQGRFYINASETGAENDFTITSSDSGALDILGLGNGSVKVDAQDAIIEYNGVEYVGSSNTFSLNGLTITAKSVTGEYDKTTGEFKNNAPISIDVSSDTESIYNSIKNFVNKYNEIIDEMNKLYDEKKPEYEPLTDDERSELSDTQIEKWEEKAKQGILRRDSTISSLLSSMRGILNKAVTVTMDDGTEKQFTLASLGIVTGDYSENGKLHILGDEDDSTYSSETNKLKEALESNPEIFAQVFAGDKENPGIGFEMYNSLSKAMAHTSSSSSLTFYDDITLNDDIDDIDDEIDKWNEKLQKMEDKYYDQFAAMETAMAKLQSQQSYLSSLLGGGA